MSTVNWYDRALAPIGFDALIAIVFAPYGGVRALRTALLDATDITAGERVLELGCGTGGVTTLMVNRGAQVTAIDGSWRMLQRAKKRAPTATYHHTNLTKLNPPTSPPNPSSGHDPSSTYDRGTGRDPGAAHDSGAGHGTGPAYDSGFGYGRDSGFGRDRGSGDDHGSGHNPGSTYDRGAGHDSDSAYDSGRDSDSPYDVVLCAFVLHELEVEARRGVFAYARASLTSRGRLAILDHAIPQSPRLAAAWGRLPTRFDPVTARNVRDGYRADLDWAGFTVTDTRYLAAETAAITIASPNSEAS